MPEWLLPPGSNTVVQIAAWITVAVVFLVIILFLYSLGLRFVTVIGDRRRERLHHEWRSVLSAALLSEENARNIDLPVLPRNQRVNLLEIWNLTCDIVRGSAAENLVVLGNRIDLVGIAQRLLRKHHLPSQILAIQTLGHMQHEPSWPQIASMVNSSSMAISITAAGALVSIDRERAVRVVMPMIAARRDWPRTRVSRMLRSIGSDLVSEPLYRAVRGAEDPDRTYLLQFAQLAEYEIVDALAEELIRESKNPEVLAAALKLVSGRHDIPRVLALAQHDASFVRMQVARLLGRVGQPEHVPVLESLLDDPHWWVRYRAAQSIAALPFLGPNALRRLRDRQDDRFARDILQQAYSEVGMA